MEKSLRNSFQNIKIMEIQFRTLDFKFLIFEGNVVKSLHKAFQNNKIIEIRSDLKILYFSYFEGYLD